jgi:hypothetical protein
VSAPVLVKVGSVKSHHPEPGQKAAPVPAPTEKVKKVLQQLADLPAEAEEREKSINELKAENVALRQTVKRFEAGDKNRGKVEAAVKKPQKVEPALTDADRALIEKLASALVETSADVSSRIALANDKMLAAVTEAASKYIESTKDATVRATTSIDAMLNGASVKKLLEKLNGLSAVPQKVVQQPIRQVKTAAHRDPSESALNHLRRSTGGVTGIALPPGEHAVLTAALTYPEGVERQRLTVLTGYKRSTRDAYIVRLTAKGLIKVDGTSIVATPEGIAALPDFEPLPSGKALVDYWRNRLPEGERKVLDVLLETGGDTDRELIDESTGFKRSTRDAYLVRMRARGVVVDAGRGMVRASAELLEGR